VVAEVSIRRARPADVSALVALCIEHAAFEGVSLACGPDAQALQHALFGAAPPLLCWVAEYNGEVLGYATATREFSTWQAAYYLHMDCLYLKPEGRNNGLGERLMGMLAGDALRLECKEIQWQTPAANLRAASFYRRLGAQAKDKLRFYLTASDLDVLARCCHA